jgi:hypothetical protein
MEKPDGCFAQELTPKVELIAARPGRPYAGYRMPASERVECPGCHALFQVVRASSGQAGLRVFDCKVCKRPLVSEHDGKIIAYFLIRRPPSAS